MDATKYIILKHGFLYGEPSCCTMYLSLFIFSIDVKILKSQSIQLDDMIWIFDCALKKLCNIYYFFGFMLWFINTKEPPHAKTGIRYSSLLWLCGPVGCLNRSTCSPTWRSPETPDLVRTTEVFLLCCKTYFSMAELDNSLFHIHFDNSILFLM